MNSRDQNNDVLNWMPAHTIYAHNHVLRKVGICSVPELSSSKVSIPKVTTTVPVLELLAQFWNCVRCKVGMLLVGIFLCD